MTLRSLIAALAATVALAAHAATPAQVRAALARNVPHLPSSAKVLATPYSGLFEVDVGHRVFYTDAAATYMFAGDIIELKSGANLTQARLRELQHVSWKDLPLKDSFTVVYGSGRRQIAVFEDPYCPYCHALEQNLAKVGDITAHVFLLPVIRPESPAMARDIWCAPDRGRAWQDWMERKKAPPHAAATCKDPLQANMALGESLGIESTPTMILTSGDRTTGALPPEAIEQALKAQ